MHDTTLGGCMLQFLIMTQDVSKSNMNLIFLSVKNKGL